MKKLFLLSFLALLPAFLLAQPSGQTQPVSLSKGGTGATTAAAARVNLGVPTIDPDAALTADSDALVPSQKAVKTYVNTHGGAVASVAGKTGAVTLTAADVAGAGDVSAASAFGTDGLLIISNGTEKGVKSSSTLANLNVETLTLGAVSGILGISNGGNGSSTPGLVPGSNITVTGSWPNQTINASSSGGSFPAGAYFRWTTSDLANKPTNALIADGTNGTANLTPSGGLTDLVMGNGNVSAPSFSPAAGSYGSTQSVTISSATTGSTIKYTTDGVTTPSRAAGSTYSSPVPIAATTTLKAMAFKNLYVDSGVTSGTYTISTGPAFVREDTRNVATDASGFIVATISSTVSAGQRIVIAITGNGGANVSSVVDSAGNTYTLMIRRSQYNDDTVYTYIYSAPVTTALSAGSTITTTFAAANYYTKGCVVCVLNSSAASGQPDASANASTYGSTISASGSPASTPTLLFAEVHCQDTVTYSGSGWTAIGPVLNVSGYNNYLLYKTVTGTAAQDMGGTLSGSVVHAEAWVSFK